MNRRQFLRTISAAGAGSLLGRRGAVQGAQAPSNRRRPNVVLFVADDLGYGELGCYGQTKIRTPNIDRLAAEGVRFTQAYAGSHVCAPSRSVLMTGLHSGHTPVRANGAGKHLYDEDLTVAEVLKRSGYATGAFGKWGLGNENSPGRPNLQGFDEFMGQLEQVHAHFYYPYWIWRNNERYLLPENEGKRRGRYVHDVLHGRSLQFIRQNKDRPFFCYIPCIIPHVELVVPEDSERPYRGKFPKVAIKDPRRGYISSVDGYATFAGMVSRMDRAVGEILALLKELNIDEDTVVIFTSDNGGQGGNWRGMTDFFKGNGPLRGHKGSFYEGGIRVPMIVRWPGRVQPGSTSDHVLGFQDILPTVAGLAGVTTPEGIDGISLLPTLLGRGKQPTHHFLYWEYPRRRALEQAVRMGDWKLIKTPKGKIELYNVTEDPGETRDVAAAHPDIVKRIKAILSVQHATAREYASIKRPTIDDFVR